MNKLAGIFFQMRSVDSYFLSFDGDMPGTTNGMIVLGDLVSLGQVGIEIILPIKLRRGGDFAVEGKPGLDGHSNGAEQIAFRARDCGMDITYDGIRLTPQELVSSAQRDSAHVIGLSILSGSHLPLVKDTLAQLRDAGLENVPVVVGGIIPEDDANMLLDMGVARVYTPKNFELNSIMKDIVELAKTNTSV